MPSPAHHLFGLPEGELEPILGLALVYAAIGGAFAAGDVTVQAVFMARAGVERLPEVLLIRALLSPMLAFAYARVARPRPARAVLCALTLMAAGADLGAMVCMRHGEGGALAAYVVHELVLSLVTVHWGVYLLDHLGGDRALRGVALVYAAARGGGVIAGALLLPIARADTPSGMWLVASLFALAALLAGVQRGSTSPAHLSRRASTRGLVELHGRDAAPAIEQTARASLAPERRAGYRLLLRSRLLVSLALATGALVLIRFVLRYQQQALLQSVPEQELATLLAGYTIAANALGMALQLFVLSRVLPRIGLPRANSFYAAAVGVAQLLLFFAPGLASALAARFADSELKHAVKTPLSSLFYQAFRPADRAPARAAVLAVVSPAAQILAALGLGALVRVAPAHLLAMVGIGAALLYGVATIAQNRSYVRAIRRDSLPGRG